VHLIGFQALVLAIFVPKIIRVGGNLIKLWQK